MIWANPQENIKKIKLHSMRNYVMASSIILLAGGIIGFAFKGSLNIPGYSLLADLVLGVWGMFVLFSAKKPK